MAGDPAARFKDVEIDGVIYRMPADDSLTLGGIDDEPIDPKRKPAPALVSGVGWNEKELWVAGLQIPWPSVTKIVGIDPWPRFAIIWRYSGYRDDGLFTAVPGEEELFGARVEELAETAQVRSPKAVEPGWIGMRELEWEAVSSFPDEVHVAHGDGPHRTSALARSPEPVIARRAPRTSTEAILAWLASGPDRQWRAQSIEVVVTPEYVYSRTPAGVFRLPLAALRAIVSSRSGDRLVIFGKRTQLLLQRRADCPVLVELKRQLSSRGAAP